MQAFWLAGARARQKVKSTAATDNDSNKGRSEYSWSQKNMDGNMGSSLG
jgi:hypothetical protein